LSPLPDDPIQWLTEQPYVEIVKPPRSVTVGGAVTTVADVRVAPGVSGIPCPDGLGVCAMPFTHASDAFPMVISSEYVTRVVDLRMGSRRALITASLGTPAEALLDTLCVFATDDALSAPTCLAGGASAGSPRTGA
jgi:hypothetical protein